MKLVLNQRVQNDPTLLKAISKTQGIPIDTVAKMMRNNTLTPTQLASLTGKSSNSIRGMLNPWLKKGGVEVPSKLTKCYTHLEVDEQGNEKEGTVLILRDKNCEDLLRECNGL